MSLLGLVFTSVSGLFTANTELSNDTRAHQLAEAAHRRNHAAISRVLRGIDIQTLSGFNNFGVATSPSFRRVSGMGTGDLTYVGDEQLVWVEAAMPVDGIEKAGALYLSRDGQRFLVADRVPADGFELTQEGQSLAVRLTTYHTTSRGTVVTKTSESAISIRN